MHSQLRLAERQGLLQGPYLSPVQHLAAAILDAIERIEKSKSDDRALRLALVANGNYDPEQLFDELKQVETDDSAEIDDGTTMEGEAVATKYDFSHAEPHGSQAEVEREIAALLAEAASQGSGNLDDELPDGWL